MKKKALSGLSGLMAIAIILSHCGYIKYCDWGGAEQLYTFIFYFYGAVTFFFMKAGYLARYTFRDEERLGRYVIRKIKRIYPLHFLTLFGRIYLNMRAGQMLGWKDVKVFVANLLLVHAWIPKADYYFSFNTVSWFLSALFFCYIIGFALNKYKINIHFIIIAGYIIQIVLCMMMKDQSHWLLYISPFLRTIDFCMGMKICDWSEKEIKRNTSFQIYLYTFFEIGVFCVTFLAVYFSRYMRTNWTYCCVFIVPFSLMAFVFSREKGILSHLIMCKPFQKLGGLSFELFMTHKFIINWLLDTPWFIKLSLGHCILSVAILLLLCVLLAWITHMVLVMLYKLSQRCLLRKL